MNAPEPGALDRAIVAALQGGMPLTPRPYDAVAEQIGVRAELVRERVRAMLTDGRIRRIGAVPNHYALGYTANAMSVWDVADEAVAPLGARVGALPAWPYNLFCMIHGRDRDEVESSVDAIARRQGLSSFPHARLFSRTAFKQRGALSFASPSLHG